MEVANTQIFNLWDTNGRRSDVLNALSIYLNILKEMNDDGSFDNWASYPESLTQFNFYKKAIENSPEVFRSHPKYDDFVAKLNLDINSSINKRNFKNAIENTDIDDNILDEAIEQRARHYTSNLVRFGFANDKRIVTPAGQSFINEKIDRDELEKYFPLNDVNIILLRQLSKLRIYGKNVNGTRKYYSPFYCALYLLMQEQTIDKNDLIFIIQGLNPYDDFEVVKALLKDNQYDDLVDLVTGKILNIPIPFLFEEKISENNFNEHIKNRKSGKSVKIYYDFYCALYDYLFDKTEENYTKLREIYKIDKDKFKKAFFLGKNIFDFGTNCTYDHSTFMSKNEDNIFIKSPHFNELFYKMYEKSKFADGIFEYSDTTLRILTASGLFKFKIMPELSNKKLLEIIFSEFDLCENIFGTNTEEEYIRYEKTNNFTFGSNISLSEILNYSQANINKIYEALFSEFKTDKEELIKKQIENSMCYDFNQYISEKYPEGRVIQLLELFTDRNNDLKIKNYVNESATIPTIYEYLIGIAWFYISGKDFDLFRAFNLTLNADFEPEMHAGGGAGDIIINYDDMSILLEVTLMNKLAQKRGEWEPVLRHSLNNKADNIDKDTITFFVADELDYNTINIWRAVASAPLRSSGRNTTDINGVTIMPLTNKNIIDFIKNGIKKAYIVQKVKESFAEVPKITEANWHQDIIDTLMAR